MCGKSQKTSTSTVQIPEYVETAYKDLIAKATPLADTAYDPATARGVAGFTGPQQQAFQNTQNIQGIQNPYLTQAQQYAQSGASTISGDNIAQYLNPYQSQVIDATMSQIGRNNAMQQSELTGNAALRGALGGDRVGVAQAELARNQDMNTQNILAQMNQQNYNQALSAAQADKSRAFQGASAYGALGNQAQQAGYQDISALLGIGGQQQALGQQQLDTASANAQQAYQHPFDQMSWLSGITTGLGSTAGSTTTQTQPGPSALSQIAGIGLTAASMFSDERVKEDIKPVGATFDGQPIYKFRYKGDPAVHMGLMAQDVEQRHPEAVGEVGGIKTVDYDRATKGFADGGWINSPMLRMGLGMLAQDGGGMGLLDAMQYGAKNGEPTKPLFPETGKAIGTTLSGMFGGRNLSGFANGGNVGGPPSHMDDILSRVQSAAQGLSAARRAAGGKVDDVRKGIGRPVDMDETSPGQWEPRKGFANGGFFNDPYGNQDTGTLDLIKGFEGYAPVAQWDVRQHSGGYGTKAQPGEKFTPEIAERRLREEVAPIDSWIDSNITVPLSPEQRSAFTSFAYNLGVDDLQKLLPDINRGDWQTVSNRMRTFNNVLNEQGVLEPSEGLTRRRMEEAGLVYSPEGGIAAPPAVSGGNEMARGMMAQNAAESVPEGLGIQPTAMSSSPPVYSQGEESGDGEWNVNLPLLMAGLGMLASDSPFPGVAIGQGGMQGVQMLMQQREAKAAARKLADAAAAAQERLGIQRETLEERKRHNLSKEAQGSRAALSKNVIWGSDEEGNPVILQASPEGELIRSKLPEGVTPIRDTIRVDAGDRWVLLDPVTRQKVGEEPKNLREAASETAAGGVEGKATQEAKATLPTVRTTTKRVLGALDALDKSPIRESFTGYSGYLPNMSPEANDYQALLDQVAGNVFLTAFNDLRGGGAITEAEGQKATASLSRLGAIAPSDEGYQVALDETRGVIKEILTNAMIRAGKSEEEIHQELQALDGGASPPASGGGGYKVLKVH